MKLFRIFIRILLIATGLIWLVNFYKASNFWGAILLVIVMIYAYIVIRNIEKIEDKSG